MSPQISVQSVKTILKAGEPSVRQLDSLAGLVQTIKKSHPGGVNMILIGQSQTNLFKIVQNQGGIIAVLIGLLLPAVQKITTRDEGDVTILESALRQGGSLGLAMCDGSV